MLSFLTICLSATFIATGVSLSCETCSGYGHTCEGPLEDCPPNKDTCSIKQLRTSGVFQMEFVEKACLHSRECNKPLHSMDGVAQNLLEKIICCMGKECDKDIPPLPPINTTSNGGTCPGCYSINQDDCEGVVVECTGDNIYCIEFRATAIFENWPTSFLMKGCANYNVSEDIEVDSSSGSFTIDNSVSSSGSPIDIPGSPLIFLQTVFGLLLHKILL